MSSFSTKIHPSWILVAVLAGAVWVHQSDARRPVEKAAPTVWVMVDLEKVFRELLAKEEAGGDLKKKVDELEGQRKELADKVDRLKEDLDLFPAGGDRYKKAENDLMIASIDYRAFVEYSKAKIDYENSLMMTRIYANITQSVAALAADRGYNAVLRDDTGEEIVEGTSEDTMKQISLRRILYRDALVDVTDELLEWINK